MPRTLVLVDGNSIVYRAYFALIRSPLRNSRGENTSAVFGFVNSLRKLLATLKPDYAAVVFDAPGKSFRHDLFAEYKLQRPKTPEELVRQLPAAREIVTALGIHRLEIPGVEADDVLGTIARRQASPDLQVFIVTSDKDLLQLVNDDVRVFDPFKDVVFDREAVVGRFGVGPERIADLLALSGDSSDNIPGVPGIGPKRAQEIALKFPTLDAAIEGDPRIQPHAGIARASRALTQIKTDVEVSAELEDLRIRPPDDAALIALYRQLEFTSLLREMVSDEQVEIRVSDAGRFAAVAGQPLAGISIGADTCNIAAPSGEVVRLALTDSRLASDLLAAPGILKVGFDLKPELKHLRSTGVRPAPIADVMIAAWLLDPNQRRSSLPGMMLQFLNRAVPVPQPHEVPVHALSLWARLQPELEKWQLMPLFREIEMPLVPVLADMEMRGVRLDIGFLAEFSQQLAQDIDGLERKVKQAAGLEFNLGSPRQLAHVLFDVLKLKPGRRTKTGFSTDAHVLQELARTSAVVADILQWRELGKLQSTYLLPLMAKANAESGRVHTTFNQTGAATGRLSASEPNLQNVPIRTELGRRIRRAFVAEPGFVLVSADYSQIELRILAEITGDGNLREAFRKGEDIHRRTAAAVMGISESDVTPESRRIAKMVNYGLIYGMSDFGLAGRLGIDRDASRAFIAAYLSLYPKVDEWTKTIADKTRQEGVARTLFGRIRPLPDLQSPNQQAFEAARRAAINTPIQGTAADIIKRAMIAVDGRLSDAGLKGGMVLQIHDELLFEIEQGKIEEARAIIREAMESAWQAEIPLKVDIGTGRSWAEAH